VATGGLPDLERRWDDGARHDAMYVILSEPEKKGQRWDPDAFFESGRKEIGVVVEYAAALGVAEKRGRALDFGCGIGRLSEALADHFEHVDGVDVSSSMVAQAREHNRHGERCEYHYNPAPDLQLFPDDRFDLVYSNVVLQHIEPDLSRSYVSELVRVLAPGGLLLFQLPSGLVPPAAGRATTASAKPLRKSAFAAAISVDRAEIRGPAGMLIELPVSVTNRSKRPWPARGGPDGAGQIKLGNHWLADDGTMLLMDDERAELPSDVAAGQSVEIAFPVTLPEQAGEYVLELDLVQENVTWFAARGSTTTRVPTTVTGREAAGDSFSIWQPTCLDVHAVPRDDVLALLANGGATVLDVVDDASAGPGWISFRYAATKPR
jgi:SAM-dependent methyltransferase